MLQKIYIWFWTLENYDSLVVFFFSIMDKGKDKLHQLINLELLGDRFARFGLYISLLPFYWNQVIFVWFFLLLLNILQLCGCSFVFRVLVILAGIFSDDKGVSLCLLSSLRNLIYYHSSCYLVGFYVSACDDLCR